MTAKKKKRILSLILCVLLGGAAWTGWMFYEETRPERESETMYEDLRRKMGRMSQEEEEEWGWRPDFQALNEWNPDVAGWIYGPGTVIDYPIVQSGDNTYYLEHTADRKANRNGAVFMDYRNQRDFSDDLTVVYGHHIRGGRMFSSLSGYKEQEYYEEHPKIYVYTPDKTYCAWLWAGCIMDGVSGSFPLHFDSHETWEEWVEEQKEASTFASPVTPEEGELMAAFCTCTYEYYDARYVVYGVLRETKGPEREMDDAETRTEVKR